MRQRGTRVDAARVVEVVFNCVVLADVLGLAGLQSLETLVITVEDVQRITDFSEPKVEVRDLTSKLMPVQGDEPRKLVRD